MKRTKLYAMAVAICCCMAVEARIYDVREMGADATGKVKCSAIVNGAIEKASKEGGGTVYFPAGEYLTGAIYMKSNITLDIEAGAVVRFSDDFEDYLPFIKVRWEGVVMNSFAPLINAANAENITIRGRGAIDGQGRRWWENQRGVTAEIRARGDLAVLTDLQRMWERENSGIEVSDYYRNSLKRRFFRPPLIQFYECRNILIEGVSISNSPFWTINPEFCDNVCVRGVTIKNPENGPNTDGINPSSCSNVRISDCFISVGDDCITIKSGRDADGRKYARPCENITITNCVMLSGHGGVVIGSEMSGGVRKVAISNCVFNGTDAGIRLKSSRGRGGVVEEIRVDNIVMDNIRNNAFIFDLFYDKASAPEPLSERTPVFRNIHISNVTGKDVRKVGYITGLEESPVEEITFSNINMEAREGFTARTAGNVRFRDLSLTVASGPALTLDDCRGVTVDNISTKRPDEAAPLVEVLNSRQVFITNCLGRDRQSLLRSDGSSVLWGSNFFE